MSGELIKVGKYDLKYNKILDIDIAELYISFYRIASTYG